MPGNDSFANTVSIAATVSDSGKRGGANTNLGPRATMSFSKSESSIFATLQITESLNPGSGHREPLGRVPNF